MALTQIRIFRRRTDGKVIWYHAVDGPGEFPTTKEEDLKELQELEVRDIAISRPLSTSDWMILEEVGITDID